MMKQGVRNVGIKEDNDSNDDDNSNNNNNKTKLRIVNDRKILEFLLRVES
jgi:hypothetical protein